MREITKIVYQSFDGCEFTSKENALTYENGLYETKTREYKEENRRLKERVSLLENIYDKSQKKEMLCDVPESSGIYMLSNPFDNYKKYIGSAVNLRNRYQTFLNEQSSYSGKKINAARSKTKPNLWTHTILELCEPNELEERENFYIGVFDTINNGYNHGVSIRKSNDSQRQFVPITDKKLKTQIRNNYETFKYALHNGIFTKREQRSKLVPLGKGEDKVIRIKYEQQSSITEQEVWKKKTEAEEIAKGEKVSLNLRLFTLNKNLQEYTLTVDDIIYLPHKLNSIMCKRQKYQNKTGLKTGVIYNKTENMYTAHLYSNTDGIDEYIRGFLTEDDAYTYVIEFKKKQIQKYAEIYKDKISDKVFNIIMNLTNDEVERLICC